MVTSLRVDIDKRGSRLVIITGEREKAMMRTTMMKKMMIQGRQDNCKH